MKGIILAAGRGSRMGQLTEQRPKCMVEFQGKSLLSWQREAFAANGVSQVGVVCGYRKELLETSGLTTFQNGRWQTTNMVRSLQCAHPWLSHDDCIVSYSDIFYYPDAVQALMNGTSDISVLYDLNWRRQWELRFEDPLLDAETLRLDSDGRIREIGGRASTLDEIEGQYMGLLKFTPRGWLRISDYLESMPPFAIDQLSMTALISQVISAGETVVGLAYAGIWGEIDTPADLKAQETRLIVPGHTASAEEPSPSNRIS